MASDPATDNQDVAAAAVGTGAVVTGRESQTRVNDNNSDKTLAERQKMVDWAQKHNVPSYWGVNATTGKHFDWIQIYGSFTMLAASYPDSEKGKNDFRNEFLVPPGPTYRKEVTELFLQLKKFRDLSANGSGIIGVNNDASNGQEFVTRNQLRDWVRSAQQDIEPLMSLDRELGVEDAKPGVNWADSMFRTEQEVVHLRQQLVRIVKEEINDINPETGDNEQTSINPQNDSAAPNITAQASDEKNDFDKTDTDDWENPEHLYDVCERLITFALKQILPHWDINKSANQGRLVYAPKEPPMMPKAPKIKSVKDEANDSLDPTDMMESKEKKNNNVNDSDSDSSDEITLCCQDGSEHKILKSKAKRMGYINNLLSADKTAVKVNMIEQCTSAHTKLLIEYLNFAPLAVNPSLANFGTIDENRKKWLEKMNSETAVGEFFGVVTGLEIPELELLLIVSLSVQLNKYIVSKNLDSSYVIYGDSSGVTAGSTNNEMTYVAAQFENQVRKYIQVRINLLEMSKSYMYAKNRNMAQACSAFERRMYSALLVFLSPTNVERIDFGIHGWNNGTPSPGYGKGGKMYSLYLLEINCDYAVGLQTALHSRFNEYKIKHGYIRIVKLTILTVTKSHTCCLRVLVEALPEQAGLLMEIFESACSNVGINWVSSNKTFFWRLLKFGPRLHMKVLPSLSEEELLEFSKSSAKILDDPDVLYVNQWTRYPVLLDLQREEEAASAKTNVSLLTVLWKKLDNMVTTK